VNTLIWAQDELLAAEAVDEATDAAGRDAEVITLDAEDGLDGVEEAVFAGSLFASKRLVVLRNAQTLNKAGVEKLVSTLRRDGEPADVVITAVAERPPAPLMSALSDVAAARRLERPRRGELIAWVMKRMKRAGLDPGRDGAPALVETVGESLRDLAQAIDQLALRLGRGGKAGREIVLQHFSASTEQPIWILFDAIVKHEGGKAFEALRRLLAAGDEPLPVLGALVSQIRGVIKVKAMVERDPSMKDSAIAKAVGLSEGRVGVIRRQAPRLTWDWLFAMHEALAQADFELKGGEDGAVLPGHIVLERVVAFSIDSR
jgi:DNA polymerase-3 subunit delta